MTPGDDPRTAAASDSPRPLMVVGRYGIFDQIGSGGMATVHLARLFGSGGFARVVAIKRMRPRLVEEQEFIAMFRDEARLAARVVHPNVVQTLDVVEHEGELLIVMEYVHGESLARLISATRERGVAIPPALAAAMACAVLNGLHAAHEARTAQDEPLGIVHRDVSPQNILVGCDGTVRVLDFGVARAMGRQQQVTREGQIKGKIGYLPPELLLGGDVDRRADIYGVGVVLWETLTGARLFEGPNDAAICAKVLLGQIEPVRAHCPEISDGLEAILMKALAHDPSRRFSTAREMAVALQRECGVLPISEIGDWVERVAREPLAERARQVSDLEKLSSLGSYSQSGWSATPRDLVAPSEPPSSRRSPAGTPPAGTVVQPHPMAPPKAVQTAPGHDALERSPLRGVGWFAFALGLSAMAFASQYFRPASEGRTSEDRLMSCAVTGLATPISIADRPVTPPPTAEAPAVPIAAVSTRAPALVGSADSPPPKAPRRVVPRPRPRVELGIDGF